MSPATRLRYALETALVYALYGFFRILPLDVASGIGGAIGRTIGPHLPSSVTARDNLAHAFRHMNKAEREAVVRGMWDNLGRVLAEYPHLHRIWDRVELIGGEHLIRTRESGTAAIFCGAHLANWEISAIAAKKHGVDVSLVYRKPNNPWVDGLLRHARDSGAAGHIRKSKSGAREMLAIIKDGGVLGLLIDQRLSEGLAVPFFGRDAKTAPALAQLALRHNCPVYPSRVERLEGCRFRMTIYPALTPPNTGDAEKDVLAMMTDLNQRIEDWVRERPAQWLWIHRRWG